MSEKFSLALQLVKEGNLRKALAELSKVEEFEANPSFILLCFWYAQILDVERKGLLPIQEVIILKNNFVKDLLSFANLS